MFLVNFLRVLFVVTFEIRNSSQWKWLRCNGLWLNSVMVGVVFLTFLRYFGSHGLLNGLYFIVGASM